MSRSLSLLTTLLGAVVLLGLGAYWLTAPTEAPLETSMSVAETMGSDTTGYRRATEVRPFTFPADHGPHPGYKTEWWYVTGNLSGPEAQPCGYELTVFHLGLTPPDAAPDSASPSNWRTNQLSMAHFGVTGGASETFHAFERFQRGGAGLAGVQADPFRVWLNDWSMTGASDAPFPSWLRTQEQAIGVDLTLHPPSPLSYRAIRDLVRRGQEAEMPPTTPTPVCTRRGPSRWTATRWT